MGGEILVTLIVVWLLFLVFKTVTTIKATAIFLLIIIGLPIIFIAGHILIDMWFI